MPAVASRALHLQWHAELQAALSWPEGAAAAAAAAAAASAAVALSVAAAAVNAAAEILSQVGKGRHVG